jgi:hypothetical protein
LGVSVQHCKQLGGHADFLQTFIWNQVSGLMHFLTADQKQQYVNFCEDLHQIPSDNATFLSRVITGNGNWIYGYNPETKQQTSQWKMKSKVKSMLIIFFDIKGLFTKNLSWQAKQSILHITVIFYGNCENV